MRVVNLATVATDTRVWLHRGRLDTLLARGERPDASAELRRRAEQLGSPKCRKGLAVSLRNALKAAHEPPATFSSRAPLSRQEIRACASLIEEVAAHLEGPEPVSVRGVALVERLLSWGGSPLYAPHLDGALEGDLRHARAALLLRSR